MRFFEKTKGAISLFLVIILVPMLTLSGLFVDASKVNLGRAMAESAGDLTLNTALTNYDSDLKELYGLMATAQSMDDLFERLEGYYKTCIMSSGVSEAEAETYAGEIMAQLGVVSATSDTADIMNMQVVDFAVEQLENANLANATILEKQIVDFMKYRAPINTGLSFLNSLKSFSTLSKQTELVEKKQKYYEAQQGVMGHLQEAWIDIAKYNSTNIVQSVEYLKEIQDELGGMKNGTGSVTEGENSFLGYNKLHEMLVMDLYHVGDYVDYLCTVEGSGTAYSVYWKGAYCTAKYTRNFPTVASAQSELQTAVTKLKGAIEAASEITISTEHGSPYYDLQLLVQYLRNGDKDLNVYTERMAEVQRWYKTVEGLFNDLKVFDERREAKQAEIDNVSGQITAKEAKITELENASSTSDTSGEDSTETTNSNADEIAALEAEVTALETSLTTLQNELSEMKTTDYVKNQTSITVDGVSATISSWYNSIGSSYSTAMVTFDTVADVYTTIAQSAKTTYDNHLQTTKADIAKISKTINDYLEELKKSHDNLADAKEHLEDARDELAGNVASLKGEWDRAANDESIKETSLAKQDQAEIDQLDTYLTVENVQKLINRIENIRAKLEEAMNQLKEYKYCGKFIGDIKDYNTLESAIHGKYGKAKLEGVSTIEDTLRTEVATFWSECWQDGGLDLNWVEQQGCEPDLTKNKSSMYSYLYSHFAKIVPAEGETKRETDVEDKEPVTECEEEDTENGEEFYKSIKKNGSDSASAAEGDKAAQAGNDTKGNNITGESLPSNGKNKPLLDEEEGKVSEDSTDVDKAAGNATGKLNGLFKEGFLNAVAGMATDLRDKLYVADYAMSMFTYDTIENEYKIKNDKGAVEAGDLLSLTKCDLSKEKNYAYGAEVEYIIYGGTNQSNINTAYGTIYGIRFGFNLVYAFATSEIRDSALAIATPISAATLGIIPVPLIQAAIIVALACCESAIDIADLRDGYQIPLYKSQKTWTCSVSGLTQKAVDEVKEHTNALIDEGLNKLNELLDMTDEEFSKAVTDSQEEIIRSVENAYNQLITENAEMALQRLTMAINTAVESTRLREVREGVADSYEENKSVAIEMVKKELKAWGDAQSGSDLASKIRQKAAYIVVDNCEDVISDLFDAMETTLQDSEAGQVINTTLNVDSYVMGAVTSLDGEIMECIADIRLAITDGVTDTTDEIGSKLLEYKDTVKGKITNAAETGAEELKTAINDYVDGICGDTTGTDSGITSAGFCSFAYSDYLRLFTLIGLYVNEEATVLRIGDVIQTNMAKVKGEDDYELAASSVYVKISAEIQVKPTFMALPLFADVENNPNNNEAWYTIHYTGVAGY